MFDSEGVVIVEARQEYWRGEIGLFVGHRDNSGAIAIAKPIEFDEYQEGAALPVEPCIMLEPKAAADLMTTLWQAGVRPQDVVNSNEALNIQGAHLEDMRRIAFDALNFKLPSIGLSGETKEE